MMRMTYKKPLNELLKYLTRQGINISNLKIIDENDNGGDRHGN